MYLTYLCPVWLPHLFSKPHHHLRGGSGMDVGNGSSGRLRRPPYLIRCPHPYGMTYITDSIFRCSAIPDGSPRGEPLNRGGPLVCIAAPGPEPCPEYTVGGVY